MKYYNAQLYTIMMSRLQWSTFNWVITRRINYAAVSLVPPLPPPLPPSLPPVLPPWAVSLLKRRSFIPDGSRSQVAASRGFPLSVIEYRCRNLARKRARAFREQKATLSAAEIFVVQDEGGNPLILIL